MVPDPVVLLLVDENIEVACQAIEKAAMERAVAEVDDGFLPAYEARRRHRQVILLPSAMIILSQRSQLGRGQQFWDSTSLHSSYQASLPEPLRLKPSGVQPNQLAVYDDFSSSFQIYFSFLTNVAQALTRKNTGPGHHLRCPIHATTPRCTMHNHPFPSKAPLSRPRFHRRKQSTISMSVLSL